MRVFTADGSTEFAVGISTALTGSPRKRYRRLRKLKKRRAKRFDLLTQNHSFSNLCYTSSRYLMRAMIIVLPSTAYNMHQSPTLNRNEFDSPAISSDPSGRESSCSASKHSRSMV